MGNLKKYRGGDSGQSTHVTKKGLHGNCCFDRNVQIFCHSSLKSSKVFYTKFYAVLITLITKFYAVLITQIFISTSIGGITVTILHVGSLKMANISNLDIYCCFELNWCNILTEEEHKDYGMPRKNINLQL